MSINSCAFAPDKNAMEIVKKFLFTIKINAMKQLDTSTLQKIQGLGAEVITQ